MEISIGKSKDVCILLVNEDRTCKNIVSEMLQHCNYQELHVGCFSHVRNNIRERKNTLKLLLTNANILGLRGEAFLKDIRKEFNLPITLMDLEDMKIVLEGKQCSFSAYVLNDLSKNDLQNLWEYASRKEKGKMGAINEEENVQQENTAKNVNLSSSINEKTRFKQNCKRKEHTKKNEDSAIPKKQRVVWSGAMHEKFLDAIKVIGYEKAVPKKIVEVMNIEGLTRENVASHLQKFRGGQKRAEEIPLYSIMNTTNEFKKSSFLPQHSTYNLNLSQPNSYFAQNSYSMKALQQNTQNKFFLSNTLERNNYANLDSTTQFSDGKAELFKQKYFPNFQLNRNFRIYSDQTKNMLLRTSEGSSSTNLNQSSNFNFVGYRLTNNGNSINFGHLDHSFQRPPFVRNPEIKISSERITMLPQEMHSLPVSISQQQNPLQSLDTYEIQNTDIFVCMEQMETPVSNIPIKNISVNEVSAHDQSKQFFENSGSERKTMLPQEMHSSPVSISQQQNPFQSLAASEIKNTDIFACMEQRGTPVSNISIKNISVNEVLAQDQSKQFLGNSDQENVGTSSTYVSDEDFLLPQMDTPMLQLYNDFLEETGVDILPMNEIRSVSPQIDWEELDDILFNIDS